MFEFIFALVGFVIAILNLYQVLASVKCTKKLLRELESVGYIIDKKVYSSINFTILLHTVIIIAAFVIVYYFFFKYMAWFSIGFIIGFLMILGKTGLTSDNIEDVISTYSKFITLPNLPKEQPSETNDEMSN